MIPLERRDGAGHRQLKGLAFEISDLCLLRAWAERRGLAMTILLDQASTSEVYEEVVSFRSASDSSQPSAPPRVLIWRDATDVFVQPAAGGQLRRHGTVAEALEALAPRLPAKPADIRAAQRPTAGWRRLWV